MNKSGKITIRPKTTKHWKKWKEININVKISPSHKSEDLTLFRWKYYPSCYRFNAILTRIRASLVVQLIKNPSAMLETWVWSLGWEDPLEKGKATHSSILVWRIPWTEEPGRLQSTGLQRVWHNWATFTFKRWLKRSLFHSIKEKKV